MAAQEELPPYLAVLNEAQREAVFHTGRPLLILAGAGSGKTRVITTKIAWLIREKHIKPWSILAVTFTNKAAKEMAERAAQIESEAAGAMLRTFHSFGAWFLRRNAEAAGLGANFTIYDDDDAVTLLAAILPHKKKDDVRLLAHQIARAKDHNLGPYDDLSPISSKKEFEDIYARYEERLAQTGNVDFGDLIRKPIVILKNNADIAARIRGRFRVIMVDEYQDANIAQFELLCALAGDGSYVCVVGDDDQSIYRFRGAEVRNILDFPAQFGGADIIKLEQNYRSTSEILNVAHSVVEHNAGRHGKKLEAARGKGARPKLFFVETQEDEAAVCAELIENAVRRGAASRYNDWAILYRTNAQSLGFENDFVRRAIPYKIVGSLKFYEREEIKDALALLCFMANPRDEVSFKRVINKPARGIGGVTLEKILAERWNEQDWNIETTLMRVRNELSSKARAGCDAFCAAINAGRAALDSSEVKIKKTKAALQSGEGLSFCVATLINAAGIAAYHRERDEVAGEQRAANLQEFVNNAILYPSTQEGLTQFLEDIELDRSLERDEITNDCVTLITLHNTKGLEFRNVIITGLEQGLFPREGKVDEELEEERRLFYVGATRAMDNLYFTSCSVRRMWGQTRCMEPSLFLREADSSQFDIEGAVPFGFMNSKEPRQSDVFAAPRADFLSASSAQNQRVQKTSSDGRWTLGDRIFNDDNGYGEVCGIEETENGAEVAVRFEAGHRIKFLSAVQSRNYMKIQGGAV